jgi:hypothetical protein
MSSSLNPSKVVPEIIEVTSGVSTTERRYLWLQVFGLPDPSEVAYHSPQ